MNVNARKIHSFVGRCLYLFLLDGTMKAYGVILERTVSSFNTNHAMVGFIFTFQTSVAFMSAPVVNRLQGRLSPRIVAVVGGFLASAGFVCRAVIPLTAIWQLLMALTITGLGFGMVNFVTLVCLKDAFGKDYPTVFTVAVFSIYVGICTLPPLLEYLTRNFGESIGMLVFGGLTSLLVVSGIFTGVGGESRSDGVSGDLSSEGTMHEVVGEDDAVPVEQVRQECDDMTGRFSLFTEHREFVFLFVSVILAFSSYLSWSIYLVPYGQYLGLDPATAVWLSTIGGIGGIFGKAFGLPLLRRQGLAIPIGVLIPTILLAVSYGVTLFLDGLVILAAMSIVSGYCLSIWGCIVSAMIPLTVCDYHFKDAIATTAFFSGATGMMGAFFTGAVFDVSESYRYSFAMLAVVGLAGTVVSSMWYRSASILPVNELVTERSHLLNPE